MKMTGFARTLRYVPFREDLFAERGARHERPEARDRAAQARRGSRHRGARGPDRRHGRRHPRAARAGQGRHGHRHRRRDPRQRSAREARHPRLPRSDPPRGARPAPRTVGGQHHDRLRGRDRDAGRHHRRRRRRRHRRPPHLAKEVAQDAAEQELQERFIAEQVAKGESVDGLYPIGRKWQAAYEAWLGEKRSQTMKFRGNPATIRGSIAPVVSPFTADGAPDLDGLRALIRWQLDSGSAWHLAGRVHRRAERADRAERAAAIRAAADEIRDRVPFVPGTGSAKLPRDARAHGRRAGSGRGRGADHHPVLRAAHPGGPVSLVPAVAAGVPRPAAHRLQRAVPHRGGHRAGDRRAAAPGASTTSSGSRRPPRTSSTSPGCCTSRARDTLVWSGIELLCLPLLALGGAGFVSATANLAPAAVARMYEHWEAGELDKARELHFGLHPVTDVIFTETNPAAAKWVLARAGLIAIGFVRPPLVPLTEPGQRRLLSCCGQGAPVLEGPVARVAGGESLTPEQILHFIDGRHVPSATGRRSASPTRCPTRCTRRPRRRGARTSTARSTAARIAFEAGPWPRLAARARAKVLNKIADGIESRADADRRAGDVRHRPADHPGEGAGGAGGGELPVLRRRDRRAARGRRSPSRASWATCCAGQQASPG